MDRRMDGWMNGGSTNKQMDRLTRTEIVHEMYTSVHMCLDGETDKWTGR
jgi:hypothetical protein